MDEQNFSRVLLGLSGSWELQCSFLVSFNLLNSGILLGNFLIVFTVISDPALHTPMYSMLSNLSVLDVFLATYSTPRMIHDFLHEPKIISFEGCMTQSCCMSLQVVIWCSLLPWHMTDTAICKPLHYTGIMNLCKCTGIVIASWLIGVLHSLS